MGDTTWTTAASPYELDCAVQVSPGVTLAIQPGVVVESLPSAGLTVGGTLRATGTPASKITFQAATTGGWPGIELSGADPSTLLEYAEIRDAAVGIHGAPATTQPPYTLAHDTFSGDVVGLELECGGPVAITSDTFTGNQTGIHFSFWEILYDQLCPTSIQSSIFMANGTGLQGEINDTLSISNTTYKGNIEAVQLDVREPVAPTPGVFSMEHSNIVDNTKGVELSLGAQDAPVPSLEQNNFSQNLSFNIRTIDAIGLNPGIYIDGTNNWWGTTNRNAIQRSISDCTDSGNMSSQQLCVKIDPYLSAPDSEASAALGAVPTATPTTVPPTIPPPTPTTTPTPTAVESFAVDAVKIESVTEAPDYSLHRISLANVRARKSVRLSIYLRIQGPPGTTFVTGFRVTSGRTNGPIVYLKRTHHSLASGAVANEQRYSVAYTPAHGGQFTFTGTLVVGGKHKHKSVLFGVASA
jgi:hypothetical protein